MQFVPEDGVYVYFRYNESKTVMVVMNQNEEAKPLDMTRFSERTKGFSTGMNPVNMEQVKLSELQAPGKTTLILELK